MARTKYKTEAERLVEWQAQEDEIARNNAITARCSAVEEKLAAIGISMEDLIIAIKKHGRHSY